MKSVRNNLLLIAVLFAFSFGCDSQSGVTDNNVDKKGGGSGIQIIRNAVLPQFLTYSVIGGEEVTLNGSPIWLKESFDPELNSDVHSNENVILNGHQITVEGFVTYVNNIIIDGDNISIAPNFNPNSIPHHYQVPSVEIPHINVEDYKSMADIVYDGDKQLSGNLDLGTQSDPLIIYVSGNLYLDNVVFNGYGIILAEKEVDVVSDVIDSSPDPDHSKLFIITGNKFILNSSSSTLHATVYAKYEININAEHAFIEGSLASLSKNTLNGNGIDLRFKLLYSGLSELIFGSSDN